MPYMSSDMVITILDAVETFEKSEFLDYLRRLKGRLHERRDDDVKDAIDAIELLINIVDSADSATWRHVAKDLIVRMICASRMKVLGWRLDYD